MADFLLELLCEEIPARMQAKASDDLARLFGDRLAEAGLTPAGLVGYVTPRRLALIARGLPERTEAVREEHKGPRTSAPEKALEGFLRKTGLTKDALEDRDGIWFAVVEKPGRATAEVLAEVVPAIVHAFPWPKSMRWGAASLSPESLRWVRPLQGIVALLGETVVPVAMDGLTSGRETVGHRFHSTGPVSIASPDAYVEALRAAHVIVDAEERRALVSDRAHALAAQAGYTLVEDKGLVAENAGLTEWPVPLLGRFDPDFLQVPPEVIQLTLRINQKYFVLRDGDGKLAPAFICTANIEAKDGGAAILAGNGKVLAARLSDARFFWEQDKKVRLADQAKKLDRITFHQKLGTVADKVARVATLAEWLAREGVVPNCDPALARQAAELCKADLVTEMVGEFPELQGLMGGYYAREEGLDPQVADAIRDHYKPVGQGDEVPVAPVSVAVALADKLDTLATFFWAKMPPTGSKDPFALRRAALAALALMERNGLRLHLTPAIGCAIDALHVEDAAGSKDFIPELLAFFADRLKVQQKEAGVRHDLIDAVFALGGEDDLVRLLARVAALQAFVDTDDGANLLAGYKRAANILRKEEFAGAATRTIAYTAEPEEGALMAALDTAEAQAADAVRTENFAGAMSALASLRGPIDAFFDKVTVNDADSAKRLARLGILVRIRDAVHQVADFSKIEG